VEWNQARRCMGKADAPRSGEKRKAGDVTREEREGISPEAGTPRVYHKGATIYAVHQQTQAGHLQLTPEDKAQPT